MAELYLKNAHVASEEAEFRGGILIEDGKIVELVEGDAPRSAKVVQDLQGQLLLPGIVDDHVHFNEPGRTHWEGYATGSRAAAAGGVTTIMEMPLNATPPTINSQLLAEKRALANPQVVVDYASWGGLVDNNLADLEAMHQQGVIGFKAFMSNSGVDFERIDDDILYGGLEYTAKSGAVIGLHAENEYLTTYLGKQMQAAGRIDRAAWCESRPPANELEAIQRAVYWAGVTGGNLHIVHISVADGIDAIQSAKQRGVHVTAETCPHYLVLTQTDFERIGPSAKCAPPLRTAPEVERLWERVLAGQVDTIASDHSPTTWEEKAKGLENIWKGWGGITGIQTMLPAMLSEGINRRGLSLPAMVRMMSANPARIFGLYPQKGSLQPGADADLVVVDLDSQWTLRVEDMFSKNQHSAYVGHSFKGKVLETYVRGQVVYRDGQIVAQPGSGRLVLRKP
jgi:allantoinase